MYLMKFDTAGYVLSYILSVLMVAACFTYAISIRVYFRKHVEKFTDPDFKKRYGEVYNGIKEPYKRVSLTVSEVFIYRRIMYAFVAVYLTNWKQAQQ